IGRGGQITFHGPGQLVGYPVLNLGNYKKSVRDYVDRLEEVMIQSCKAYDVESARTEHTGVWVGDRKIAALGVSVSRWITQHGFALNCNVNMDWYNHIVPCGIDDKGVTSLSLETGKDVSVEDVLSPVRQSFGKVFECDVDARNLSGDRCTAQAIIAAATCS
ncbi:lipoyl(octanoyl) transferase, partial [Sphaeroforma arctica JP610]